MFGRPVGKTSIIGVAAKLFFGPAPSVTAGIRYRPAVSWRSSVRQLGTHNEPQPRCLGLDHEETLVLRHVAVVLEVTGKERRARHQHGRRAEGE
jgi:hypothetical protein